MTDIRKTPVVPVSEKPKKQPQPPAETPREKKVLQKKPLDRIAEKSAQRAAKTEKEYDKNHNIFTKWT